MLYLLDWSNVSIFTYCKFTAFQTNLTELKSFGSPPAAVVNVAAAVMVLLSNKSGKIPKDRSWKAAKAMMGKVTLPVQLIRFLF